MKNFKQFLALLFLTSGNLVCMDSDDSKWKLQTTKALNNEVITIEVIEEYPDQYEEINASVEGHRAFKKTTRTGHGDSKIKTEIIYSFEGDNSNQAPVTAFSLLYSKSPKGIRGWSSTTKVIGGSLLFGLLFYGIKKLYERKTHSAL